MITIDTIQNILMAFTIFFLILYGIASLAEAKPHWLRSKTFLKTRKMEQRYEKMLQARRDMVHHYYWNRESKKKSEMKKQEKQIIRIDKQLQQMRSQYEMVRKGLPVPLKMF